jgi:hypothetical protein
MFSHRNATTTLAIMGDSLTFEHHSSHIMLLGMPHNPKEQFQSHYGKKNIIRYACDSTLKLVFRRDDMLQSLGSVLNETCVSKFDASMGSQDGRGMPVAMMKCVVFVSQPLKEWLQVSNIRETSARWSLASVDTPFICNASRHGSIRLTKRVRFVDENGNMDSRVINEE